MLTHCIALLGAVGIGASVGAKLWLALRRPDALPPQDAAAAAPDRIASFVRARRPATPPCKRRHAPKTTRATAHH